MADTKRRDGTIEGHHTLDSIPEPRAGQTIDVGFVIRQHGVTPVDLDGVGIQVTSPSGRSTFFAAERAGETGHYVVSVTFPEAGTAAWAFEQGWFGTHDLGEIEIGPGPIAASAVAGPGPRRPGRRGSASPSRWPRWPLWPWPPSRWWPTVAADRR